MRKIYSISSRYPVGGQGSPEWPSELERAVNAEKPDVFGVLIENVVGSQEVGRTETVAITNMPPNKERPDSCRSALPARLICAPGPFVGLIPYIS
jgi:hypothetical protein